MNDQLTPIRKQYLKLKQEYPDTILFFRLGDFYETFDEDAQITSKELDIVLTSRPVGKGVRAPLAGIPHHAVENYLARLVEKGYHVAICEQIGDQPDKGIFQREVVRVVTPGTIIEPNLLSQGRNNFLASVFMDTKSVGIAYADITTGEVGVTEISNLDETLLVAELKRMNPAEIILPDNQTLPGSITEHTTPYNSWKFEPGKCQEIIKNHFRIVTMESLGLKENSSALKSMGALLQYVKENSPKTIKILKNIKINNFNEYMLLDAATQRNLEITETIRGESKGSLLDLIDRTLTPMGKRLIRQWIKKPLLDIDEINLRLEGVQVFFENSLLREEIKTLLKKFIDLERVVNRIISGYVQPRELLSLKESLLVIPALVELLERRNIKNYPSLEFHNISVCDKPLDLLHRAISEDSPATLHNTGIINYGYSGELDDIIQTTQHARDWINNLEKFERERTGIKNLKVGYNKVFGYFIEISHANLTRLPEEYIRKQTLVNAERYITPELKEFETIVLNAEDRIHSLENEIYKTICNQLSDFSDEILSSSTVVAKLDVFSSLAETASINNYSRPILTKDSSFEIVNGRHPVVENNEGERFISNDIIFEENELIRIITGPNMSGKSTYLRQAALISLLAQMGSFVPATSAKIGLIDRIFTRIGAQDELHSGLSTFMVEMVETANILNNATNKSLIILDELGRGTSTYDGVSIAWSVIEFIHNHPKLQAKTLFATHYHELTQLSDLLPGVRNYNVAVSESDGKVLFLHKIVEGGADRSYGIHVAQLAGLPPTVIQRATEILRQLEDSSGNTIDSTSLTAQQVALFPENSPLIDEIKKLDINSLSPIESINKLYEWKKKYTQ